jgi:[calcium/calmodulin-dependent protein kinase] kinase
MTDEVYEPSLYDIPGEVQTLSRSNLFREYVSEDLPQINHYVRQRQLGRGAVGQVYLCYKVNPKLPLGHKHRKIPVAIKELSRQPTSDDKHQALRRNAARRLPTTGHNSMADKLSPPEMRIRREIAIMKKCWHPHVVRLLEVIDDRLKDRIYLGLSSLVTAIF